MTEEDDIDGLAAEYVLGSLEPGERRAVEARSRTDAALAIAVRAWEIRLAPLNQAAPAVEPPAHLFEAIMQRISTTRPAEVVMLRRSARRWRGLAASTTAMAACLALAFGWILYQRTIGPTLLVAELYRAAGGATADEIMNPAFVVTVDLGACKLSARAITAPQRQGRTYQLWVLRPGGVKPEPVGLLAGPQVLNMPCPPAVPPTDLVDAALAVSLEPEGGSPTGLPSGPFTFMGKLVATRHRPSSEPSR